MKPLRAGQVAAQFGRTASWLRQLETAGVIPPVPRDPYNGQRVYTPEDVERIREALLRRKRAGEVPAMQRGRERFPGQEA